MNDSRKPVILAITGASGSIYAMRTAKALLEAGYNLEIIMSPSAELVVKQELGIIDEMSGFDYLNKITNINDLKSRIKIHDAANIGATIASGSFKTEGMVVVPCSMKTLAGIANGFSTNLIERAADVSLKEARRLILVTRETPMNLIHLKNQVKAAEAGARIMPASPAFYQKPETIEDLADFIAGRVLNLLNIEQNLFATWDGELDK